jgi:hypothetical protein
MTHSVFISYSRRESPFVDIFLDALAGEGVEVWVDYRSLVPGKPWLNQILEGIRQAEVFLLVVSKASLSSPNVELEYKHALEQGKRIILIIFEAVTLPAALQTREWIDFRGSFRKKQRELLTQLDQPTQPSIPPQQGFKAPFIVWVSVLMSLLAIAISIPGWWTFYLPILLVPLPFRILKRDFNFYRIRFALLTLPLILLLSWIFFSTYATVNITFLVCMVISFCLSPFLLFLISSKGMRLWGKPSASAPRFARPYQSEVEHPLPVPFFIEYAPADKKYADAISAGLTQYGHPQVEGADEAQASFVIISRYQNSTSIDPEKHVVYPILVQDATIADRAIQQIQWIDFRRGIRNLDQLAELLSEPEKLLKALGVAPISGQVAYPRIIQMFDYFLTLLAFFAASAWIPMLLELGNLFLRLESRVIFFVVNLILLLLMLRIIFNTRRDLTQRHGRKASLGGLIAAFFWIAVLVSIQSLYIWATIDFLTAAATPIVAAMDEDMRGSVSMFLPLSCTLGTLLIGFFSLWNWRDLMRWLPSK